jgi:thiosulfate/3-mercaptopyruvate sulfurtransferase
MNFTHPDYLVTTQWLAEHLDVDNLRILDVTSMLTAKLVNRAEKECFNEGHIPGSVFFNVGAAEGVLSDSKASLPWSWPPKVQFEATMAEYGISNETHVIVVARTPREGLDSGTMWCTRAWWTMHHFGVHCSILQGGLEQWQEENRQMTAEITKPDAANFVAAGDYSKGLANKEDVLTSLSDGSTCLVDTLPETTYSGKEPGYGPRKGHIKGAVNVPFQSLLASETALFKDADAIRSELASLIDQPRVITYCGGAIAATVNAFALKLLGHDDVAVYDGSLMEWSADGSLPMVDLHPEGNE